MAFAYRENRAAGGRWRLPRVTYLAAAWLLACAAPAQDDFGIAYTVAIEGVADAGLQAILLEVSESQALRERKPPSAALLRKRAREDEPRLRDALHSQGYYGATVRAEIDATVEPAAIVFRIDTGPLYVLGAVSAVYVEGAAPEAPPPPARDALGLPAGAPARARAVIDAESRILTPLRRHGFPFPSMAKRDAVVDHAAHTLSVTYTADPGPYARFGPTAFTGLDRVKPAYMEGKLPWREGDPYDIGLVNDARVRFADMGVFSTVQVTTGKELAADGLLPVSVTVEESPARTIAGGLSFQTDEGAGVLGSWAHRNLTGRADSLEIDAKFTGIGLRFDTEYTLDDFRRSDQRLTFRLLALQEDLDAYDSTSLLTEAFVERDVTPRWTLGAGLRLKTAAVEQIDEETGYAFLATPVLTRWDATDDALDPTRGGRFFAEFSPYFGTGDAGPLFFKTHLTYRHYVSVTDRLVLAGRVAFGSVFGAELDEVPIDERFYSGGGSSVRGFDYRTVSPLVDNEPVGGRSQLEVSVEARQRLTEAIGLVLFVDGGSAFEDVYPEPGADMRWGAGLGLRIYTPAGPFRLDVAVPLNKRDGVDDDFQLYASFGHTF